MKFPKRQAEMKEERNPEKLAPDHAPALYSSLQKAAIAQSKIKRIQDRGIMMHTFLRNQTHPHCFNF